MKWLRCSASIAAWMALPLTAQALSLTWPVACTLGQDCFVQNYVDHGPNAKGNDFTCGHLTYPHHDGTDIRLRDLDAMRAGVNVVAVADGEVIGERDGMADQSIRNADGDATAGKAAVYSQECGNGVVLRHAEGFITQYCHMHQGSINVQVGDHVQAGQVLGQVGLSGDTEFPHLHLTVRHGSSVLDPFTSGPMSTACAVTDPAHPLPQLWAKPQPYLATALLNDGFSDDVPAPHTDPIRAERVAATAPALLYWVQIMGPEAGDNLTLRLRAPDGHVLAEQQQIVDHAMALYSAFVGKRNHGTLPPGTYSTELTLTRHGHAEPIVTQQRTLIIQP